MCWMCGDVVLLEAAREEHYICSMGRLSNANVPAGKATTCPIQDIRTQDIHPCVVWLPLHSLRAYPLHCGSQAQSRGWFEYVLRRNYATVGNTTLPWGTVHTLLEEGVGRRTQIDVLFRQHNQSVLYLMHAYNARTYAYLPICMSWVAKVQRWSHPKPDCSARLPHRPFLTFPKTALLRSHDNPLVGCWIRTSRPWEVSQSWCAQVVSDDKLLKYPRVR